MAMQESYASAQMVMCWRSFTFPACLDVCKCPLFDRHIPLWGDHHQGRGCKGFVEGADTLCSASHLKVCSAYGDKRNVPKRASGRGMQIDTCFCTFSAVLVLEVLCYISPAACMHVADSCPAKLHGLDLH